jgi:hypothetical protein
LATKLGFTSAAVVEFFRILGDQDAPEEKVPARLVAVATHFAQTRDALAALEPDDAHAAALARSAKEALDSGRLTEAGQGGRTGGPSSGARAQTEGAGSRRPSRAQRG